MRKPLNLLLLSLLLLLLTGCAEQPTLTGWDAPDELPAKYQKQIQQEITEAAAVLQAAATDQDAQEAVLADAGFSVFDSDTVYPTFLANSDSVTAFWEAVCAGEDASLSLLRITDKHSFRHLFFLHENGGTLFFSTDIAWDTLTVTASEVLPVYDMELADWDIFYYRLYPAGDPHYIDYNQIRLKAADRALYDLNRAYVLPVGYQLVNLFLCNWSEGNWGSLSFNDLLEALYTRNTGETLDWEPYLCAGQVWIPADVFETAILPYFEIPLADFRSLCQYDAQKNCYPFQPIHGNDLTSWHYPMCEPEVTAYTENPDGTITLDIQVYSPELKTNRLFCHALTIRPAENGSFQYVSNEVTYVSDRGLPPNMARFDLDR